MAPLWFARPGELRRAKWADMKLDASKPQWEYRVTKTKQDHIVPLSEQAVAILRALLPITGHQSWVFPSVRNNGRPMSENTLAVAMHTIGVAQGTHTIHGWRAEARDSAAEPLTPEQLAEGQKLSREWFEAHPPE